EVTDVDVTWHARKSPAAGNTPPPGQAQAAPAAADLIGLLSRKSSPSKPAEKIEKEASKLPARPSGEYRRPVVPTPAPAPAPVPTAEEARGIMQPAVLLGLGQLGLDTLQQVRRI